MNKNWVKFIEFTLSERKGILFLTSLCLGLIFMLFYMNYEAEQSTDFHRLDDILTMEGISIDSLSFLNPTPAKPLDNVEEKTNYDKKYEIELNIPDSFDPNKVSLDELLSMGIPKYAANNWIKYTSKGGKFRSVEQLSKVYGLQPEVLVELESHLVFDLDQSWKENDKPVFAENKVHDDTSSTTLDNKSNNQPWKTKKYNPDIIIELNEATEEDLKLLSGIGTYFAGSIVKYRNSLGGFHSTEQLLEVFNFQDSTYQKILPWIKVDASIINQIDINSIAVDELKKHPYFTWRQAQAIINYRTQHGSFNTEEDLRKIKVLNDQFWDKTMPYLKMK